MFMIHQAAISRAQVEGRATAKDLTPEQAAAALAFGATTVDQVDSAWAQVFAGCAIPVSVIDSDHFRGAILKASFICLIGRK